MTVRNVSAREALQAGSSVGSVTIPAAVAAAIGVAALTMAPAGPFPDHGYLLFHTVMELLAVLVSWGIMVVAWTARAYLANGFVAVLGVGFAAVGVLDLFHALAYPGIAVLPGAGTNLAAQLWIAARYLQALTLLAAPGFLRAGPRFGLPVAVGGILTLGLGALILARAFPTAYRPGEGLTTFKVVSELAIGVCVGVAMWRLWRRRRELDSGFMHLLLAAMAATIASELAFTLYVDAYGIFNAAGHVLKFLSFALFFQGVVVVGLKRPFETLFRRHTETEGHYSLLFRAATDGVVLHPLDGDRVLFTDVNPSLCHMLGYRHGELTRMGPTDVQPPDQAAEFGEEMRRLRSEGMLRKQKNLLRKDGRLVATEVLANAVEIDGQTFALSIIRDNTDRVHAEQATELTRRVFAALSEVVLVVNPENHRIETCNAAVEAVFGYTVEEVQGSPTQILHVDESGYREFARELFGALQRDGVSQTLWPLRRKSGVVFDAEITVTWVRDNHGSRTAMVGVIRDITERLRVQKCLRTENNLVLAVAGSPSVSETSRFCLDAAMSNSEMDYGSLYLSDDNGDLRLIDSSGRSGRDLPGATTHGATSSLAQAVHSGRTTYVVGSPGSATGVVVPFRVGSDLVGCMRLWARTPTEVPAYVRDSLERISFLAGVLLSRARARGSLEQAKAAAEAANKAKSAFLAGMSHELRTPLNAVIGFSDVLAMESFGPLNEKQTEYLTDIRESARHLHSLIDDVLDLSKIEAGTLEPDWSRVDVAALVRDSVVLVRETCRRHAIELSVQVAPELEGTQLTTDPRRLKQIMYNLLSNAAKFTPDGGSIRVSASILSPESEEPGELEIAVEDTGTGIAAADLESIFEEFHRSHNTRATGVPGTGLGLSLVRRLVRMHGGRVWAESEGIGTGSRFVIALPLGADTDCEEEA